jgi:hypothetical protein
MSLFCIGLMHQPEDRYKLKLALPGISLMHFLIFYFLYISLEWIRFLRRSFCDRSRYKLLFSSRNIHQKNNKQKERISA